MQDITVKKTELLEILKENRKKHLKVYTDARAGYIKARKQEALDWLELLDAGKIAPGSTLHSRPEKHEDDYDAIISMLEMHTGDEITMDMRTYRQYVMDQWAWRDHTLRNFSTYAAESTSASYGSQDDSEDW